ncbi:MAG: TetR/AcrR family transcriptional regulator [Bacteroidia bacterium]|nr:TetR/AcrR family transcriptional regulator [Bacteroidia bacterium]
MPAKKTSKEELTVKAMQLFRKKGYFNTSIKDLSEACNIPKSHFYYYFKGGKVDLMVEVLEAVRGYFTERVFPIATNVDLSNEEKWSKIAEKLQRIFLSQKGGCIMGLTTLEISNAPEKDVFLPIIQSYFSEMINCIEGIYTGQPNSRELATRAVQDIQGGLMLMQLYGDSSYFLSALERSHPNKQGI